MKHLQCPHCTQREQYINQVVQPALTAVLPLHSFSFSSFSWARLPVPFYPSFWARLPVSVPFVSSSSSSSWAAPLPPDPVVVPSSSAFPFYPSFAPPAPPPTSSSPP